MQQRGVLTIVIGVLTGLVPAAATGAQEQVPRVTLEQAISLFAQHNLQLQIARGDAQEVIGLARQAAAYPNPAVSVTHEALSGGSFRYSETYFNLSQAFQWPWVSSARRTAASRIADALSARVAADSARLAFEVKRAFIEAAAAERALDALARATAVVSSAEGQAAARFSNGDLSNYELQRLRVQRARYDIDLAAATLALSASRRSLTSLILPDSTRALAPVGLPDGVPSPVTLADALSVARVRRPELAAAAHRTGAAHGTRSAARAERLPVPTLTAGYKEQSDGLSGAFLGLGLPIPLFDRKGGAVAAGEAAVSAAAAREVLVAREVEDDVRAAHDAYLAARANLSRAERVGDTGALLSVARVSYEEGDMTLVELFDAVDAFHAAHVITTRVIADAWVGWFDLERAVGAALDTRLPQEVR